MFNKKILKVLDGQDLLLQKTRYGVVAHGISDNSDKRDEDGKIAEYALESVEFSIEDCLDKEEQYMNLFYHILYHWGDHSTKVRVFKNEESVLEKTLKEEIADYGDEFLIPYLDKLGYEVKKKETK